ncbi:hypothetical protein M0R04_03380 [Candidatus Dojkabacteria bacterium]|jgi:hypothetical protein|nr:hypothetical protein [Candidatus Dojkabacteria bacterium]
MNYDKRKITYKLLPIALTLAFFFVSPVSAQNLQTSSLSIGYAPTAQFLKLNPGEKYKGEINAWNLAPSTTKYNLIIKGFSQVENYPGTAKPNTDEEEARDVYSAASWVKIPFTSVALVSNQYNKIPFTITVPKDAANGEFHAIIYFQSQTASVNLGTASGSFTNLGAGPALFISVGKDRIEKAEIEFFKTDKSFYELPPVTFLTRYLNKGNTHITPAGDIAITNFLGQEVDRITFNSNQQSLLRGNGANYQDEWMHKGIFFRNGKLAIGPLKAQLVTTYLSVNPGYAPLSASTSFWVLPWKHILAILIIAGIMYKVIFRRKKKNEKKNVKDSLYNNYPKYN